MGVLQNSNAIPTAGGAASFYDHQIAQSARFDRASRSRLSRTFGTPTSQKKYTLSMWLKRSLLCEDIDGESYDYMNVICKLGGFSQGTGAALVFNQSSNEDKFSAYGFGSNSGGTKTSEGLFRDVGGFNHILFRYDTTESTAGDRIRVYVNGSQITLSGGTDPSLNSDLTRFNTAHAHYIGDSSAVSDGFDGYLAEVIFADGQSYAPTQFGESKNGVWIPKDPSGTTFGNNGFHLKFQSSSALGDDSSGNNNDFTAANMGADHQVLDSPTFGS